LFCKVKPDKSCNPCDENPFFIYHFLKLFVYKCVLKLTKFTFLASDEKF